MIKLIHDLWRKNRNLVSDDYDQSLEYISKLIPLKIHKIPSGTKCWTWTIPEKWSVKEAWIKDLDDNIMLDFKDNPLHVMSYSLPINKIVSKEELMKHIHTRADRPNSIPYEFKFYERDWGLCIEYNKLNNFDKNQYRVLIDAVFSQGELKIGEYTIR